MSNIVCVYCVFYLFIFIFILYHVASTPTSNLPTPRSQDARRLDSVGSSRVGSPSLVVEDSWQTVPATKAGKGKADTGKTTPSAGGKIGSLPQGSGGGGPGGKYSAGDSLGRSTSVSGNLNASGGRGAAPSSFSAGKKSMSANNLALGATRPNTKIISPAPKQQQQQQQPGQIGSARPSVAPLSLVQPVDRLSSPSPALDIDSPLAYAPVSEDASTPPQFTKDLQVRVSYYSSFPHFILLLSSSSSSSLSYFYCYIPYNSSCAL